MKLLKLVLHYSGVHLTKALVQQVKDIIVIDAKGDYDPVGNELVYKIENKGFNANWNQAFELVKEFDFDWIWIANNDISIKGDVESFFNILKTAATLKENVAMVSPVFNAAWENCKPNKAVGDYLITHGVEFTAPLIKRSFLERCGFFPAQPQNGFGTDLIYSLYAEYLGYVAVVAQKASFYHYGSVSGQELFGSKEAYWNKGFAELHATVLPALHKMSRTEVIQRIIDSRKYKSYCEIGIGSGENFTRIQCERKVGIDPFTNFNDGNILKTTAPGYFSTTGKNERFDIIFIDGDHRAEFVFCDFVFAKKVLNPNGVIVFHDINPPTEWHTRSHEEFIANPSEYCGTAYRAYVWSINNSGRQHYTIATDFGVGIIDFSVPKKQYIEPFLDYSDFSARRHKEYNFLLPQEFFSIFS